MNALKDGSCMRARNAHPARSAPLGSSKQKVLITNFMYTRTPATPGPAHAQFSSGQFSSVGAGGLDREGALTPLEVRRRGTPSLFDEVTFAL